MFDVGSTEVLVIAVLALLVIGPKDLPRVLNQVGKWIGKARSMTRHFKSGLETMAREAELEDMEKQWADHNAKIMGDAPMMTSDVAQPSAPPPSAPPPPPPPPAPPPPAAEPPAATPDQPA